MAETIDIELRLEILKLAVNLKIHPTGSVTDQKRNLTQIHSELVDLYKVSFES